MIMMIAIALMRMILIMKQRKTMMMIIITTVEFMTMLDKYCNLYFRFYLCYIVFPVINTTVYTLLSIVTRNDVCKE